MVHPETLPNPNPRNPSLCEECNTTPWKYRCPSCSIRSCSLLCVKSHKSRTNCTGKRNRTEFVPLSKFDDNLLISDYNILEETKRVAESACRMAGTITGFRGYFGFRLPKGILMLRNAANRRGTKLLLLPPAMSKRQTNQSRFDRRKNAIFWTIEWRFHATDVILVDHGVDEHAGLFSIVEKHLAPTPMKNQLSPYRNVQIDDLKFLIRKTPKGLKSPFRELNIRDPIGIQLADAVILEYPVIFVFLPSHTCEFAVEKHVGRPALEKELLKKELPGSFDKQQSPKGVLFTEEEIEEGEMSSDAVVTDLLGSVPCARIQIKPGFSVALKADHIPDMQITREAKRNCSSSANSVRPSIDNARILQDYNMEISREVGESSNPGSNRKNQVLIEEAEMNSSTVNEIGGVNFDFQQELNDAYSELMGEINPDDFLCFDGELDNLENFLREDELEEGEIPSI